MADTLYEGHHGLARYADQQILYQWNKFEERTTLPYGAFLGQCDPRSNCDEWLIVNAHTSGQPQLGKIVAAHGINARGATIPTDKPYRSGDSILYLNYSDVAMVADFYAEGIVAYNGLVNRVMGHNAVGTTGVLEIELEYPWQTDIASAEVLRLETSKWGGVQVASDAGSGAIGWSPLTPNAGAYHWIKKEGDVKVRNESGATIAAGSAVAVHGTGTGNVKTATAGDQQIGVAQEAIANNAWGTIFLTIGM